VLPTATGFIVDTRAGPVLVTNRHVVTGRRQDTGKPLSEETGALPTDLTVHFRRQGAPWHLEARTLPLLDQDGSPLWREHPELGARADIVALPLPKIQGVDLTGLDMSGTEPEIFLAPAVAVSVVGYPFGLASAGWTPVWATGYVATEPDTDWEDLPVMLIDCRTRPGQSGSPVIANRAGMVLMMNGFSVHIGRAVWRFLGVYSGRIRDDSDLGTVWKVSALQELIASVR
jgi:trypsin-like peptidase